MAECDPEDTRTSYDRVAGEYARRLYDELRHKPLDRELLDRFAADLRGAGPVCDVGCGPGQVARYLHDRGVAASGLDLSPEMVALAREVGEMRGDLERAGFEVAEVVERGPYPEVEAQTSRACVFARRIS